MIPVDSKKSNGVTLTLPHEMQEDLRNAAKKEFTNVSSVVRRAIAEYLEKHYGKKYE